jgi:hypothetical protein
MERLTRDGYGWNSTRYTVKISLPGPRGGKGVLLLHASIPADSFDDAVDYAFGKIRARTRDEVVVG